MLGAIAGDIIGSVFERHPIKITDFPLFTEFNTFTDDTVLTVAVADAILSGESYLDKLKEYYRRYPRAAYGPGFRRWAASDRRKPYFSFGNGAAMRVSPVGFAFRDLETVLKEAEKSAAVTHNHPEGIKGAQATAAAVFLAKQGESKENIRQYIEQTFEYDLSEPLDEIRKYYRFDMTCQGTVPQAIIAFLESHDFENAIRKAISLGGDSDTLACITGGIAHAYYKHIPDNIVENVYRILDDHLKKITETFMQRFL